MKKFLITLATTLGALAIVTTSVYALGTLTPSGTAGDDTQYSLNDIYNKLTDFSNTYTEDSGTISVPGSIAASFYTLSDIYGLLEDEEADLVAGNIADGVTIFGVEGTYTGPTLEWSTGQTTGVTWTEANTYCNSLDESGIGWRLPTAPELLQAFWDEVAGFGVEEEDSYWTSDTEADLYYYKYMGNGELNRGEGVFPKNARCVR